MADEANQEFLADLHIHSRYSRACSRNITPQEISLWAQLKGISVIGTGDFTHPGWLAELEEQLVEDGSGLLKLKTGLSNEIRDRIPAACRADVRFVLSSEVSTIYKTSGRTRKVHLLVLVPDFTSAHRFSENLGKLGNIASDGRPILGLDCKKILEMVLELQNGSYLIPAHIWTPWFSVLGNKSGFNSIEECFGELSGEIPAVESGLSSDPPMNWRLSSLDPYTLVSNSDAHSLGKIARECNIFECKRTFRDMLSSLETGQGFGGTVEFFPQEGKYHFDGHRKCNTRLSPEETRKLGGKCPVCGKPVTVGVMHRVLELANREPGEAAPMKPPFESLIPLSELIGKTLGVGPSSKRVNRVYFKLLDRIGPELHVLRRASLEPVSSYSSHSISEGIRRMRRGQVYIQAGYDGEFGDINLFSEKEEQENFVQLSLF